MSLRTDYTGTLDSKLAQARAAGLTAVSTTNLVAIAAALTTAADRGQKSFTVNFIATYQPADLRLLGPLWEAYKTGIMQALAVEDIMANEAVISLNTSDQLSTSINLKFQF